jgi:HSP20 family protein
MMKTQKQSQGKDPWSMMEQLFQDGFPFHSSAIPSTAGVDTQWLERVVQDALTPSTVSNNKQPYPHTQFETHKSVIIRIRLPRSIHPELLRLYVGASTLRIEGFPNQYEKKVRLPCEVKRNGIRSIFKDDILEIRMVKKELFEEERQINIIIE